MFAVACASGVAVAVTSSEPALVVPPEPLPTNARVLPFDPRVGLEDRDRDRAAGAAAGRGVRVCRTRSPRSVTAPEPTCAPPMPASVEAPDVTSAFATPNATAIAPIVTMSAVAVAVFAEFAAADAPVPFVTWPR